MTDLTIAKMLNITPIAPRGIIASPMARMGVLYCVYLALLSLSFAPMVGDMVSIWLNGSAYHHCLFALPIALWLFARRHNSAPDICISPSSLLLSGLSILFLLAIMLAGKSLEINTIQHIAFAGLIISGFVAFFGFDFSKYHLMALIMVLFMIPVGDIFIAPLQAITTGVIAQVFDLTGMTIIRTGYYLKTDAGWFHVAQSCSGMRFTSAAAMLSFLYGVLNFSNKRMIPVFMICAMAFAIIVNFIRAYLMVLIATLSDLKYATGVDHLYFGWFVYFATFIIIILMGNSFARRGVSR